MSVSRHAIMSRKVNHDRRKCILLIRVLASTAPLQAQNATGDRIIGGAETTIDQLPYQVSLRHLGDHVCGGAIISPKHVISGAGCVRVVNPSSITILAGSTSRFPGVGVEVKPVVGFVRHPGYKLYPTPQNDISIVFVATDFAFGRLVQPIRLPQAGAVAREGAVATVSGWGAIKEGEQIFQKKLRWASVSVVGNEKCNVAHRGLITEAMMCAGDTDDGKDACNGDGGGPLTVDGLLIGIVSWGQGCGRKPLPGVYTRVSYYVEWISKTVCAT